MHPPTNSCWVRTEINPSIVRNDWLRLGIGILRIGLVEARFGVTPRPLHMQ